jgi:hypothetical protein
MNKFLICLKFLVTVLICFSLISTILTAESAFAAEESDQLLENAGDLLKEASETAIQAIAKGDSNFAKKALEQANTAAGLLARVVDTAQKTGNAELALEALKIAGQTSNVISDVLAISRETANVELTAAALDVVELTSVLISNIAAMAQETDNPPLAQAALSAASNSRAIIIQVSVTARFVAQTSTDRASVEAAEKVVTKSETVLDLNTQATSTALAAGAIPEEGEGFEPGETPSTVSPLPEEPPIQDTEAASQV